jgi:hypothetical protein
MAAVNRLAYLALLLCLLVAAGCAPTKVTTETSPNLDRYPIKTIVVMPFEALETPQIQQPPGPEFLVPQGAKRSDITIPVVPKSPDAHKIQGDKESPKMIVPPYAAEKITQMVYGRLKSRKGIRVFSPSEARQAVGAKAAPPPPDPTQAARKLSADAAVTGRVLVYQERVGSKLGADPAAVGFEMKLISTDGTVLWIGNYYEKQRPMNEDFLGFVQRRGVFVTAEELAEYGVNRVLQEFPFGTPSSRVAED